MRRVRLPTETARLSAGSWAQTFPTDRQSLLTPESGISDPSHGAGNVQNDPGITGLTDTQLKSGLPAGFDKKVWAQKANVNSGYPYLVDPSPG
jgi:hypothetical protein